MLYDVQLIHFANEVDMPLSAYKPLATRTMPEGVKSIADSYWHRLCLRIDSPAIDAMSDFRKVTPATIGPEATLVQAEQKMIACGVRLLLVLDPQLNVLGLITARDIVGERPVKLLESHGGKRSDLKVLDLMTPRHCIDVLDIATVESAKVGHIVATLRDQERQHALVVDCDRLSGEHIVRGVFSATQIGRLLGINISAFEAARTFAEIEAVLVR